MKKQRRCLRQAGRRYRWSTRGVRWIQKGKSAGLEDSPCATAEPYTVSNQRRRGIDEERGPASKLKIDGRNSRAWAASGSAQEGIAESVTGIVVEVACEFRRSSGRVAVKTSSLGAQARCARVFQPADVSRSEVSWQVAEDVVEGSRQTCAEQRAAQRGAVARHSAKTTASRAGGWRCSFDRI